MPIAPSQYSVLFVVVFLLLGAMTAVIGIILRAVLGVLADRHPEWILPILGEQEEVMEELIRREQAKGLLYGYPEDEVEMVPSNCDV